MDWFMTACVAKDIMIVYQTPARVATGRALTLDDEEQDRR
jgi:hypothetical protein